MRTPHTLLAALLTLLPLTACSTTRPGPPERGAGLSAVLFAGDSVAAGEAVPLTEAFAAAGVRFRSLASDGGGNVVGPNAESAWAALPGALAEAAPSVVVYQITTYDWGTEREQTDAYTRLSATVAEAGATLVLVTAPPIRPDDFYAPHMQELSRTRDVARAVADASGGRTRLLDAAEVWGAEYRQHRDGKADRSGDGVHTCPQGAARFTAWLLRELAALFPGFTPPAPGTWANTGWSADRRFIGC